MSKLLTITELAQYLGISRPTAYKTAERQDFPKPLTIEKRRRWNLEQIDAWRMQQNDK